MKRILAIDYGTIYVGLALTDDFNRIALAYKTINGSGRDSQVIDQLEPIINEHNIGEIVLGLPLNMDGSEGQMVERIRKFKARLETRIQIPVQLIDERFTTVAAHKIMRATNASKTNTNQKIDAVSAALILEMYLDKKNKFKN